MKPCKNCPYYKDDDIIKTETHFVYDGEKYELYLDDYTRDCSHLLVKFHIIVDMKYANKFLNMTDFFDGLLLKLNIPVKCYISGIKRDGMQEIFKVSIIGEERENK